MGNPGETVRARLAALTIAAGVAGILVAGTGVGPAAAGTASAAPTVDYTCTTTLLGGIPLGSTTLSLDALDQVTVPVGGTIQTLTSSVPALGDLLGAIGGLVQGALGTASGLTFSLGNGLSAPGDLGDGAISIPDLPVPALAGLYDLTAPADFVVSGVLGSASCLLDQASGDVIGTILVTPAADSGGTPTTGGWPTPGGSTSTGATSATNGGPGTMRARLLRKRITAHQHGRVAVSLRPAGGRTDVGAVTVREGHRKLGSGLLVDNHVTIRLKRLEPGRHHLRVGYGRLTKRLRLRVTR